MGSRVMPEPSIRVEPSLGFQYTWRKLTTYTPDGVEDVKQTLLQCRKGLFHLERSIAFVSDEVLHEMHHSLDGLDSVLRILSEALNEDNFRKINDAAVSIFTPLEPWVAAVVRSPKETLRWSYCYAKSMRLLLEPLMPAILADIPADKVVELEYRFDAAKRHIAGIDDIETIVENITRKERAAQSPAQKALRWLKEKFTRKPKATVVNAAGP